MPMQAQGRVLRQIPTLHPEQTARDCFPGRNDDAVTVGLLLPAAAIVGRRLRSSWKSSPPFATRLDYAIHSPKLAENENHEIACCTSACLGARRSGC